MTQFQWTDSDVQDRLVPMDICLLCELLGQSERPLEVVVARSTEGVT